MNAQEIEWNESFTRRLKELMEPSASEIEWERQWEEKKAQEKVEQRRREEAAATLLRQRDEMPYSEAIATELVERLASGELLTCICANDPRMPTARNVSRWLKIHHDFNLSYQAALLDRCVIFAEDCVRLVDEINNMPQRATPTSRTEKIQFIDPIQKAKLQVEVRRRYLAAYMPQRWSDQSSLTVRQENSFDFDNLSDEELEKTIAELDAKEAVSNRPGPHFRASQQGQK